jgi:hypothetical protein
LALLALVAASGPGNGPVDPSASASLRAPGDDPSPDGVAATDVGRRPAHAVFPQREPAPLAAASAECPDEQAHDLRAHSMAAPLARARAAVRGRSGAVARKAARAHAPRGPPAPSC